jgi:glycosyltransferase involved in cell wall biosynthesis
MIMNKIKIAFLIGSLTCGGAEKQVVNLLNTIDRSIFIPYLIILWDNHDLRTDLKADVNVFSIQFRKKFFISGFLKLLKYIHHNEIKIVHSHMYKSNLIASISHLIYSDFILLTGEHGKNRWKKWNHHFIEKKIISRQASLRITASDDIRNIRICHDGADPNRTIYIPNGTSVPEYTADVQRKPHVVGFLGRLEHVKDISTMIFALEILSRRKYDLRLKIAGKGSEFDRLQKIVSDHNLDNLVELVGFQNTNNFLRSIDIFVMSSLREGIPLSLLEAMAHGLPCVVTNVGGIPDVITDGLNGQLVPPGKPHEFADRIARFVDDDEFRLRTASNAKKTIIENYSINVVTDRYSKLYLGLYQNCENIC